MAIKQRRRVVENTIAQLRKWNIDNAETRETVLSQLRHSTQSKVVAICSAIGYTGLNVYVHHVINATGGKDANQLIQKLGRGLRRAPDKDKARRAALENEGHPVVLEPPLLGNAEQELQSNTSATPALPPSNQKQRMKILPIKITSKYPPYRPAAGPLPTHSLFMDDFLLKLRELQDMEARERESLQLEQTELLALREQYSLLSAENYSLRQQALEQRRVSTDLELRLWNGNHDLQNVKNEANIVANSNLELQALCSALSEQITSARLLFEAQLSDITVIRQQVAEYYRSKPAWVRAASLQHQLSEINSRERRLVHLKTIEPQLRERLDMLSQSIRQEEQSMQKLEDHVASKEETIRQNEAAEEVAKREHADTLARIAEMAAMAREDMAVVQQQQHAAAAKIERFRQLLATVSQRTQGLAKELESRRQAVLREKRKLFG